MDKYAPGSFPVTIAHALEDTERGEAARMRLRFDDSEIQVRNLTSARTLSTEDLGDPNFYYPCVTDRESTCGISLPSEWGPKATYEIIPSGSGGRVHLEISNVSLDEDGPDLPGSARLLLPLDQVGDTATEDLPFAVRPYREMENAWRRVVRSLEMKSDDKALSILPGVRDIRRSAEEQQKRYSSQADRLLSLAREALLAWIKVALRDVEEKRPVPELRDGSRIWLYPKKDTEADSGHQKQRQAILKKAGRYGLFVMEISKLWEEICDRTLSDPQLNAIAEGLEVPQPITDSVLRVVEFVLDNLKRLDEDIVLSQSTIAACESVESAILETNRIPDNFAEYQKETPTKEQSKDARILLNGIKGMEPSRFDTYTAIENTLDNHWQSLPLTRSEQHSKSGNSIVVGAKRFAEASPHCDYKRKEEFSPADLIEELRKADREAAIPE